jgi:hypothetical protein
MYLFGHRIPWRSGDHLTDDLFQGFFVIPFILPFYFWADFRADVADFMLNQMTDNTYVSAAPGVCWSR